MTLTRSRTLLAQIWFNRGLVAEGRGNAEERRLRFAVAAQHGSRAAVEKLGSESRCAATWRIQPEDTPPIARGWEELASKRLLANCPLQELEKTRKLTGRERACGPCGATDGDLGELCTQEPPWRVESGMLHSHVHFFFVLPLPGNAFYYENTADDLPPPQHSIAGDLLILTGLRSQYAGLTSSGSDTLKGRFRQGGDIEVMGPGGWSDEMDWMGTPLRDGGAICRPDLASEVELAVATGAQSNGQPMFPHAPVPVITTWVSIRERRVLFELSAYAAGISATVREGTAAVRGGGCNADLPLGSPPTR